MNSERAMSYINDVWDKSIIPTLHEYITIPNKSPQFDPKWREHGYMNQAVQLLVNWVKDNAIPNMTIDVIELDGRTPVILIDIKGSGEDTVLLYGHLDKQPEMTGWSEGLSPWKPVLRGEKLYGRGAADDGYAIFASLLAIKALHDQNIPHARSVILIEASEESGSTDLPFYVEALSHRIGNPSLVICLDSGCGNYEQMWVTTSLRGLISGILSIDIIKEGIHSGNGSGVVPSVFRILRQLLNRIESIETGDILLEELKVTIPDERIIQAEKAANILDKILYDELDFVANANTEAATYTDLILRRTWKAALSVVGIDGVPSIENAGNVTLPNLKVKLSMRVPPTLDPEIGERAIKNTLEKDPPYSAKVTFTSTDSAGGWNAPSTKPWLLSALKDASETFFGKEVAHWGEGGSIPFMGMLGKRFPNAQFVITGVLGPHSNAHGPNEFLHINTAKRLTGCVASILEKHYENRIG